MALSKVQSIARFGGFFVSSESISNPGGSGKLRVRGNVVADYYQKILGVLCLYTEIFIRRVFSNISNILVIKYEEHNLRKSWVTN